MIGLTALEVSSLASYAIAVTLPALDALVPVLPSETAVIALGVASAGSADPRIAVLIALAAGGAFIGDNASYLLGRRLGPAVSKRVFAGARGERRRAWAQRSLDRYGARIIIACRFIPGGRTAVTLTCGLAGYPRRKFVAATACAGVIWASYAFFIGRLGGKAFEDQPWPGLLLALGAALVISVLIEVARRAWQSRRAGQRDHAWVGQGPLTGPNGRRCLGVGAVAQQGGGDGADGQGGQGGYDDDGVAGDRGVEAHAASLAADPRITGRHHQAGTARRNGPP